MRCIKAAKIDAIIQSSTNTILDNIRTIENNTGWHQHLGTPKIGIVATAIALIYFKEKIKQNFPKESDARDFIIKSQKEDGGWPYISNSSKNSNVEATCWAIKALSLYGIIYNDSIKKGLNWLEKAHQKKSEDTGWGFNNNCNAKTYYTCLVIQTICDLQNRFGTEYCRLLQSSIESSIHWLISTQNGDGSWGACKGENNSYFFTSYAISTLYKVNKSSLKYSINKGLDWLEIKLRDTRFDNIECNLEFIEFDTNESRTRIPIFHYTIPFVLTALINGGRGNSKIVFDGYLVLLSKFKNGYWKHPFVENDKLKPIWAINDSIHALLMWNQKFNPNHSKYSKYYICLFRTIWSIKKYNPVRILVFVGTKTKVFLLILFIVFISLFFKDILKQYLSSSLLDSLAQYENQINFIISLLASSTFAILTFLCNLIKRLIFSEQKEQ